MRQSSVGFLGAVLEPRDRVEIDPSRPSFPAQLVLGAIRGYRFFSRLLPNRCRYWPTCSQYALDAVSGWGAVRGSWLAVRRLGRCHPWGGSGLDPVPDPNTRSLHCSRALRAVKFQAPDEVGSPCSPR